jgi:hypothetical protein
LAAVVELEVEEIDIVVAATAAVAVKTVEVDEDELQGERRKVLAGRRNSWVRRSFSRRPPLLPPQSMDCLNELGRG